MDFDYRLSLGDLLLEQAKRLSLKNEPHCRAVRATVGGRKKSQTAARDRSSARKAARDLASVRNHLDAVEASIARQSMLISRLGNAGQCTRAAEADLAQLHVERRFRNANLLKLLAAQNERTTATQRRVG